MYREQTKVKMLNLINELHRKAGHRKAKINSGEIIRKHQLGTTVFSMLVKTGALVRLGNGTYRWMWTEPNLSMAEKLCDMYYRAKAKYNTPKPEKKERPKKLIDVQAKIMEEQPPAVKELTTEELVAWEAKLGPFRLRFYPVFKSAISNTKARV